MPKNSIIKFCHLALEGPVIMPQRVLYQNQRMINIINVIRGDLSTWTSFPNQQLHLYAFRRFSGPRCNTLQTAKCVQMLYHAKQSF